MSISSMTGRILMAITAAWEKAFVFEYNPFSSQPAAPISCLCLNYTNRRFVLRYLHFLYTKCIFNAVVHTSNIPAIGGALCSLIKVDPLVICTALENSLSVSSCLTEFCQRLRCEVPLCTLRELLV